MKTLGLIANTTKKRAPEVVRRIIETAADLDLALCGDKATAELNASLEGLETVAMLERADAVMALGGDGTLLRVVRELESADTPVIGVNIGGLGFLTSVAEDELDRALECLATDDFVVRSRFILNAVVERGDQQMAAYPAVTDIVVTRRMSSRAIALDVAVDGAPVTSYLCDGLIVATPVGSTGHALSAGGPIVAPETPAFVICPICPHTLSSRPLVVPSESEICIAGWTGEEELILAADGQDGQILERGDRVMVRRAARDIRLIHLPGHSYYAVLRQKLHWSGSSL